jgi:hypothetical protein
MGMGYDQGLGFRGQGEEERAAERHEGGGDHRQVPMPPLDENAGEDACGTGDGEGLFEAFVFVAGEFYEDVVDGVADSWGEAGIGVVVGGISNGFFGEAIGGEDEGSTVCDGALGGFFDVGFEGSEVPGPHFDVLSGIVFSADEGGAADVAGAGEVVNDIGVVRGVVFVEANVAEVVILAAMEGLFVLADAFLGYLKESGLAFGASGVVGEVAAGVHDGFKEGGVEAVLGGSFEDEGVVAIFFPASVENDGADGEGGDEDADGDEDSESHGEITVCVLARPGSGGARGCVF